ncbi:MAG: hypothetical protein ACM3S1_13315 [Hyphomicrobiales bacterium]
MGAASAEWSGYLAGRPSDMPDYGNRVEGSTGSRGAGAAGSDGKDDGTSFAFEQAGHTGTIRMKAGPRPGVVHVTIEMGGGSEPDPMSPRVAVEAEVTSQWLQAVTRGASSQNEQAVRIAEALRRAGRPPEQLPGASLLPLSIHVDAPVIRGPLKPLPPFVWLPAEYPPPPDDAGLVAELDAQGRASNPNL